jgi:glutamate:Na+ symporter, ESS family
MTLELDTTWTVAAALATIIVGRGVHRLLPVLDRASIPPAVSAGLLISLGLALLRSADLLQLKFAGAPRDMLLLIFWATVGYGARLSRLRAAGAGALAVVLAIAVVLLLQNGVGIAVAQALGEPRELGLFAGSVSYMGGHGTAAAWAGTAQGQLVEGALEVGMGSATLGLVLGGLVAGPVGVWLMSRNLRGARGTLLTTKLDEEEVARAEPFSSDRWLVPLLQIALCVALGPLARDALAGMGLQAPTFLAVLLLAIVLTNLADLLRRPIDNEVCDFVGTVALRLFLALAMLSLNWLELLDKLGLLLVAAIAQTAITVLVAVLLLYPLFGRGRDGAAASGAFIGFSLGAMPVGLGVMKRLNVKFGETPRALLAFSLAASLFTDTANALVIAAMFRWLG